MAILSFEIEGEKVLSRSFRILAEEITEMKPEFEQIGKIIIAGAQKNFKKEGTELGDWKALAESTKKARSRGRGYYKKPPGGSTGILQWTGNLKKSFIAETGSLYSLVKNTAPYFRYHQSKRRGGDLPRRVMLDMSQTVKLRVTNTLAKGIDDRVGNFGKQV